MNREIEAVHLTPTHFQQDLANRESLIGRESAHFPTVYIDMLGEELKKIPVMDLRKILGSNPDYIADLLDICTRELSTPSSIQEILKWTHDDKHWEDMLAMSRSLFLICSTFIKLGFLEDLVTVIDDILIASSPSSKMMLQLDHEEIFNQYIQAKLRHREEFQQRILLTHRLEERGLPVFLERRSDE